MPPALLFADPFSGLIHALLTAFESSLYCAPKECIFLRFLTIISCSKTTKLRKTPSENSFKSEHTVKKQTTDHFFITHFEFILLKLPLVRTSII